MRPSPDFAGDALKHTDFSQQVGDVGRHVQAQLTAQPDVAAAHSWIQPTGGEAHLPSMTLTPSGAEAAGLHVAMPGSEQGALAAAHQIGNQAVSPIIQMIMKMPGHIGLVNSFFEVLGAFFAPLKDMMSSMDMSFLAQHAEGAINAATNAVGEHLPFDLSLLPADAPILNMDGANLGDAVSSATAHTDINHFASSEPALDTRSAFNTSGYADATHPNFEQASAGAEQNMQEVTQSPQTIDPQYLAMENGQKMFSPSMSSQNIPTAAGPDPAQSAAQPTAHSAAPQHHAEPSHSATHARDGAARGDLLGGHHLKPAEHAAAAHHPGPEHTRTETPAASTEQTADAGQQPGAESGAESSQQTAENSGEASESTSYTVKQGDNLWDIAREHLGDGSKWTQIYHMNQDILGADPRMIHEGATIQLPGAGDEIANYTVQPGDNLWDISKAHLGGGEHWPDLYHHNAELIGSDPNMIHPGQHLTMDGSHSQLADASGGAHHAGTSAAHSHVASNTTTHHAAAHSSQVAHSGSHHAGSSGHDAAHAKVAHNSGATEGTPSTEVASGSQQVPQALAANPAGSLGGMHAAQPAMSLESVQTSAVIDKAAP